MNDVIHYIIYLTASLWFLFDIISHSYTSSTLIGWWLLPATLSSAFFHACSQRIRAGSWCVRTDVYWYSVIYYYRDVMVTHSSAESSDYSGVLIGSDLFFNFSFTKKKKKYTKMLYIVLRMLCAGIQIRAGLSGSLWVRSQRRLSPETQSYRSSVTGTGCWVNRCMIRAGEVCV